MKFQKSILCVAVIATVTMTGCATGEQYRANSYSAAQVNQRQEAKTVEILAVMPARVQVDNSQGKKAAQTGLAIIGAIAGGLLGGRDGAAAGGALLGGAAGAVAGSAIPGQNMVDGVSLTYKENERVYNSAQVGRLCEFKPGIAVVVSSGGNETRVQPNATCDAQTTVAK